MAAPAIAAEQVIVAAPANLAVATGRGQPIAAEQANSAVVVEQIEAALEAAAVRFKASIVVGARRGVPASAVARAVVAAEVAVDPVVEEAVVVEVAVAAAGSDVLANRVRNRHSCSSSCDYPSRLTIALK